MVQPLSLVINIHVDMMRTRFGFGSFSTSTSLTHGWIKNNFDQRNLTPASLDPIACYDLIEEAS